MRTAAARYATIVVAAIAAAVAPASSPGALAEGTVAATTSTAGQIVLSGTSSIQERIAGVALIVGRVGGSDGTVTVDYATVAGTATAGTDFTHTAGTLTFGPGEVSKQVIVPLLDDAFDEPDETLEVVISNATGGATIGPSDRAQVTIADDDATPRLGWSSVTQPEGDSGTTLFVFTATLSAPSGRTIEAGYSTAVLATGEPAEPNDFVPVAGTLVFLPGEVSKTVAVTVNGDTDLELDELFRVEWRSPLTNVSTFGAGEGRIVSDDLGEVSIGDAEVREGEDSLTFELTLAAPFPAPTDVFVSTATGEFTTTPAHSGSDYVTLQQRVVFAAGETRKTVSIGVVDNEQLEPTESFIVRLFDPHGLEFADRDGIGTIFDDDASFQLGLGQYVVREGEPYVVAIHRTGYLGKSAQVTWATADVGLNGVLAQVGADYLGTGGTVSFAPGEAVREFEIETLVDGVYEPQELFQVSISSSSGQVFLPHTARMLLNDADGFPRVSISDAEVLEGDGEVTHVAVTVSLSHPSSGSTSLTLEPWPTGFGEGHAAPGEDYIHLANAYFVGIPPGQLSAQRTFAVFGDTRFEADETFSVRRSVASVNTSPFPFVRDGTITIRNDDSLFAVSVDEGSVPEGSPARFLVTRSGYLGKPASVSYATADGRALAGADYTAAQGTVQFEAGQATREIEVPTLQDETWERVAESFTLALSSPDQLSSVGTAMIADDDPAPTVEVVAPEPVAEGDTGTTDAVFRIRLSRPSAEQAVVWYETLDGTATSFSFQTAQDFHRHGYPSIASVRPGEREAEIRVRLIGDTVPEADETFSVRIRQAFLRHDAMDPMAITVGEAMTTIDDDDESPGVFSFEQTTYEVDESAGSVRLKVVRSVGARGSVRVDYFGNPHTGFQDGSLEFGPGETEKEIVVPIHDDELDEHTERLQVRLRLDGQPLHAAIGLDSLAEVVIRDDDPAPRATISGPASALERSGQLRYDVRLSGPSGKAIAVRWNAVAPTGAPVTAAAGFLQFPAGVTEREVTLSVADDGAIEPDSSVTMTLTALDDAVTVDTSGVTTAIVDDDFELRLAPPSRSVGEADGNATFSVERIGYLGDAASVSYATRDGSALAGSDYAATSGSAAFAPGQAAAAVSVPVLDDAEIEDAEAFELSLAPPPLGALGTPALATVTILDDDKVFVSIDDVRQDEGNHRGHLRTTDFTFAVALSQASRRAVTVTVRALPGSAEAPEDYAFAPLTLTFEPGETAKLVTVVVVADNKPEGDESFRLLLSDAANAVVADGEGVGTILDEDPPAHGR